MLPQVKNRGLQRELCRQALFRSVLQKQAAILTEKQRLGCVATCVESHSRIAGALDGHPCRLAEELGDDGRADPDLRQHRQAVGVHQQHPAQVRKQEEQERVDECVGPPRVLRSSPTAVSAVSRALSCTALRNLHALPQARRGWKGPLPLATHWLLACNSMPCSAKQRGQREPGGPPHVAGREVLRDLLEQQRERELAAGGDGVHHDRRPDEP